MKSAALLLFSAALLAAADVTGHWSGTFEFRTPSGEQQEVPVYLILKQDGNNVGGTGGRDLADRHTITRGTFDGSKLVLEVEAGDNPVQLELTVDGEQLQGTAVRGRSDGSKMTAKVQAKRLKDAK